MKFRASTRPIIYQNKIGFIHELELNGVVVVSVINYRGVPAIYKHEEPWHCLYQAGSLIGFYSEDYENPFNN